MAASVILSIVDWPERIGTDWYAIGGAFGITALVITVLVVVNFFSTRHSKHD